MEIKELRVTTPNSTDTEYRMAKKKVMTKMVSRKLHVDRPVRKPITSQMPPIATTELMKTKVSPPIYLMSNSIGRAIGLTSSRSIDPFSIMLGTMKAVIMMPI